MQSCPHCFYDDNPQDNRFCDACGWELETDDEDRNRVFPDDSFVPESVAPEYPRSESLAPHLNLPSQPVRENIISLISTPNVQVETYKGEIIQSPSSSSSIKPALLIWQPPAHVISQDLKPQKYVIDREIMNIGYFSPETGPVDIDLSIIPEWEKTSAQHTQLYWNGQCWNIEDLGSKSGTFLRSKQNQWSRITQLTPLNHADQISIGPIQFILEWQ